MSRRAFTASVRMTIAALLLGQLGVVPALASTPATIDEPAVGAETAVVVEFAEPTRTFDEITLFPFPPVTVVRRGDTAAPASVSYAHTGGTATPGVDFELAPGTLSFAAGETSKTIPIKIYPDGVFEPDETIELTLGAPGEGTTLGAASSTVTIRDNDAPQVQFGNVIFTGSESGGSATITVTRTQDLAVPVGVDYSTSDGSALAGVDYTATSGTLSFGAGETSKSFTVPILDDDVAESSEIVRLVLSGPTGGAKLGALSSARVGITDNDPTPTLRFDAASYPKVENGGVATLTVHRDGSTTEPVTVNYVTTDGTATAGSDYAATSGTLSFAPGQTTQEIPVTIANDTTSEPTEALTVTLSSPSAGSKLGLQSTAKVTIAASDQQPDAQVRTAIASSYLGDNIYNTSAVGQTATRKARRTETRFFYARVHNDGQVANTIAIRGTAAVAGSTVRYFSGTTDITKVLRSAAGWKVGLKPAASTLIKVRIRVTRSAALRSIKPARVSGTWLGDSQRVDVVRTAVKVIR